ncbi:class I SAM-dependent methyltransferase [Pseudokordiimonas caeni]|uniref:class I SAM-dependent methyltransferase n=1 Tax=Pseudokordiimonas caeni TaxID=2997908 RepID=UPI00281286D4|nr:class I SAM-dependent methyltransferase [Pseudokordiimonas caeni]
MTKNWMRGAVLGAMVATFAMPALADHHKAVEAALMAPDRPAADKERDGDRKPGEVLAFAGIKPGMTVIDVNSGGGYYTEILSRLVGPQGKVIAHNDQVYYPYVEKDLPARGYGSRLANVTEVHGTAEPLDQPAESADAAIIVLAYHDYFFHTKDRPNDADIGAVLASIRSALKPGGSFIIVDHVAPAGSGHEAGDKLHRIDPMLVRADVEAAGFTFDGETDVLRNPADNHTDSPFKEGLRGKTDRFVYKFVKK